MIPSNRQYASTVRRIQRMALKWEKLLGFDKLGTKVDHRFLEAFRERGEEDEPLIIADTTAYWEYRSACIRWFLPAAIRLDDAALENAVLHELVHVLVNPMECRLTDEKDTDLNEFTVETITLAIMNTQPKR